MSQQNQRVKVAFANGAIHRLVERGIDPNNFVKVAYESQNPNLVKIANIILEADNLVKTAADTAVAGRPQASNPAPNLNDPTVHLPAIVDTEDLPARFQPQQGLTQRALNAVKRHPVAAGALGATGIGSMGAAAYGMGDSGTTGSAVGDMANQLPGVDLETLNRLQALTQ